MGGFSNWFTDGGARGGRGAARVAGAALLLALAGTGVAIAAEPAPAAAAKPAPAPVPATVTDPSIDLGDLKLLIEPLTKGELETEAKGWFDLVRAKVAEVSDAELAVRRKNREIKALDKVKDAAEKVAATSTEAKTDGAEAAKLAEAKAELAKSVEESKKAAAEPAASAAAPAGEAAKPPAHAAKPGEPAGAAAPTAKDTEIVNRAVTQAAKDAEKTGDGAQVAGVVEAASKEASAAKEVEALAKEKPAAPGHAESADQEAKKAEALTQKLDEAQAAKSDVKVQLVDYSTKLTSERTALTDRLKLVLDNLELKGGKAEDMRQYLAAIGGLNIDVTDQTATAARLKAWLTADEGGLRWARNVGTFLAYVLGSVVLAWIVRGIASRMMNVAGVASNLLRSFVLNWSGRVVVLAGILAGLSALEVNLAPLLAIIGAAGFVVAFALQGTLSNFASGLLIMVNKPFDVGDDVTVGGDIAGKVQEVNTFSTVIHADDDTVKIVPNNSIWGGVIVNRSTGKITREGEPASAADAAAAASAKTA